MKPYTLKWWLHQLDKCSHSIGAFTEIKRQSSYDGIEDTAQSLIDYHCEKRDWLIDRIDKKYESRQ